MDYHLHHNNGAYIVTFSGAFHFADSSRFRQLLETLRQETIENLMLDFHAVGAMDSAALGMLLLLRDEMQKRALPVGIQGAQGQVEKTFKLSQFDKLFVMR